MEAKLAALVWAGPMLCPSSEPCCPEDGVPFKTIVVVCVYNVYV